MKISVLHTCTALLALTTASFGAPTLANDAALQKCRSVTADKERLKCYDAINVSTVTAPVASPTDQTTSAANTAVTTTKSASPSSSSTAADFGLPATVPAAQVDKIQSNVAGRLSTWQQGTRIRLANGQVWQVTDDSRGFCDCDNPKVEITRGAFGTFFMEIAGKNNAPRVKRLQ
jgi:hypothetical protein